MTEIDYLLVCLAEECAEVQQRISKALRFGLVEKQKDQELNNKQRISYELSDLASIVEMLRIRGIHFALYSTLTKIEKVDKYMQYSKELGILK